MYFEKKKFMLPPPHFLIEDFENLKKLAFQGGERGRGEKIFFSKYSLCQVISIWFYEKSLVFGRDINFLKKSVFLEYFRARVEGRGGTPRF